MRTNRFDRRTGWTLALAACMFSAVPHRGAAQSTDSTKTAALTTLGGVFAAAQAAAGRTVYRGSCESCHALSELSGKLFWDKWVGSSLGELFAYIRGSMPKDNPYSMSDEDYAGVTAFILQINRMPAGDRPMVSDSTALARIRIVPPDTPKPGTRP